MHLPFQKKSLPVPDPDPIEHPNPLKEREEAMRRILNDYEPVDGSGKEKVCLD